MAIISMFPGGGSGSGNTLHITFADSLIGSQYTITNGDETITGTVPSSGVVDVTVKGSGTYTVECGDYSSTVDVQTTYDVEVSDTIPVYDHYIAFYCEIDNSLNFCGVDEIPTTGSSLLGKTVTTVYEGADSTGTTFASVPWEVENQSTHLMETFVSVTIDKSFTHAAPANTAYWFYYFTACESIDGLEYLDTSNVTSMAAMFSGCNKVTSLNLQNFDTSNVTSMAGMFSLILSINSLDMSSFNTSNVTNMIAMFYECTNLISLDVSNFNTSNVTDMSYMFSRCGSLTTIYSSDRRFVTTNVTSSGNMFNACSKLVGGNGTTYDSSKVDSSMAHVDTASNPGYFTAK